MSDRVIDPVYMPFTPEQMRGHFIRQADKYISNYTQSAERYREFMDSSGGAGKITIAKARKPRQIEMDERFWIATALKRLYDSPSRVANLTKIFTDAYGPTPPVEGLSSWAECLSGDLRLYFEACLPAPRSYTAWLGQNIERRQLIPYVLEAADSKKRRGLEGKTRVDALLLNPQNGFSVLIEGKVTSDISCCVSFDNHRNQITRNIDVMLEKNGRLAEPFNRRDPARTLFALLTPDQFRLAPKSRLYGWVMNEYQSDPVSLGRDIAHRQGIDWVDVSRRLAWISYEDIEYVLPGSCPWISRHLAVRAA